MTDQVDTLRERLDFYRRMFGIKDMDFITQMEAVCHGVAKEAYKKGYVAGGVDEIVRHEAARSAVEAELTGNKSGQLASSETPTALSKEADNRKETA